MKEINKMHLFRFAEIGGGFGFRRLMGFALFFGIILLSPNLGYGQGLYDDPSGTLGQWGKFKLEFGAGSTVNPNLHINNVPVKFTILQGTFNLTASDTIVKIRTKQLFLTATVGIGNSIDAIVKVGRFSAQDGFNGDSSPSGGLGFRFSPPQTGRIKMGLLFQGFYATSEDNGSQASVNIQFDPDRGVSRHVTASGTGKEKLRLIQYDLLLGVGIQDIPHLRPYGALLVSYQDRTDKGSFSGNGVTTICHTSCQMAQGPVYLSWNTDVYSDSVVGGVFGLDIHPIDWVGINFEGFLGAGNLGTQYGYTVSTFVKF